MNTNIKKQKLDLWKKQKEEIEQQLAEMLKKKGQAAQEGDLSENAAYQFAAEEAEMLSARLANVQKMIQDLESSDKSPVEDEARQRRQESRKKGDDV